MYENHKSATFYLTIGCCLAFSVSIDFGLEAYRVLIRQTPTDYLRQAINRGKSVDLEEFEKLVTREETWDSLKIDRERSVIDLRRKLVQKMRVASEGQPIANNPYTLPPLESNRLESSNNYILSNREKDLDKPDARMSNPFGSKERLSVQSTQITTFR